MHKKGPEVQTDADQVDTCRHLAQMSLVELVRRIVQSSDEQALRELHDHRTLFRIAGSGPMLLADFVQTLCTTSWSLRFAQRNALVLEEARDLTIDKFSNLPSGDGLVGRRKHSGPDCRKYFQTFLRLVMAAGVANGSLNACQEETVSAQVLQSRVTRCFRLSCLEARRAINPTRTRYAWRVGDGVIRLWMPASMRGIERRNWLATNVPEANPLAPNEHARVQAIIDQRLGVSKCVPLDEGGTLRDEPEDTALKLVIEEEVTVRGLAEVVAQEKAGDIEEMRPAIRGLGRSRLKTLILRVFDDLSEGRYEEKRLAESFGLSPATFSRFAGHRWQSRPYASPPDLWTNVAHTLAGHLTFIEMAKDAGVWPQVEGLARSVCKQKKGNDHDQQLVFHAGNRSGS